MKPDERAMMVKMLKERPGRPLSGVFATTIGIELGIHWKRCDYILNKWINKGWWECGVSARTGWFTEKGLEEAKKCQS